MLTSLQLNRPSIWKEARHGIRWQLNPRLADFVQKAMEEGVVKEALILACMLECDACSFSLREWMWNDVQEINCRAKNTKTADGSPWRMIDFIGAYPLFCMCNILLNLKIFESRVGLQCGCYRNGRAAHLDISPNKLWLARAMWEECKKVEKWNGKDLCDSEHRLPRAHYLLVNMLAAASPERRAHRASDGYWYSANGFRVRGDAVQSPALPSWAKHCWRVTARVVEDHTKSQYAHMPHVISNLCLNLGFE